MIERPTTKGLLHTPTFAQVLVATGARTVYTSGQVSIDEEGKLIGLGDLAAVGEVRGEGRRRARRDGVAASGREGHTADADRVQRVPAGIARGAGSAPRGRGGQ